MLASKLTVQIGCYDPEVPVYNSILMRVLNVNFFKNMSTETDSLQKTL